MSPPPRVPRSSALPAVRESPPAPPLIAPTGSPTLDCIADAVNSTVAPFQNAPPAEQGAAGWVAQGLGGVLGVVGAPQQLIDNAFAGLTAPIAALFPALPAITLLGMHIGMMHTHTHPPSLVPPAPPIPLPSIGMLVGSGSMAVLGCGMPLARAGDIGISVTCGSLAPPFEVFTGSSNVFVGGARAARILDITKHCDPSAMGPFGIAMAGAGIAAGAAGAIATGQAAAAAQAAADAAVLALKLLCGKDPGLPPGIGALLGPPCPTVMIGGFPCPPIGDMVIGALMKALKALARAAKRMRSSRRGNATCADGSHPIYLPTGENYDRFTDFVSTGLFRWDRHYTTGRNLEDGPLGFGFRHNYQRTLDVRLHKLTFRDWDGVEMEFPAFAADSDQVVEHGYVLRRISQTLGVSRYELSTFDEPVMVFEGDRFTELLPLVALRSDERELSFTYDDHGRLVGVSDRASNSSDAQQYLLQHDAAGRITAIVEQGPTPTPRFACTYTPAGELSQVRDATNGLWKYEYDAAHRWTRQTDPRGYAYSFRYDEQGRCVGASGQDGLWAAEVEYLPEKRLTRYTKAKDAVWEYHYDEHGFITKIVNPLGGVRVRERSPDGRIRADIDPGGRKVTYLYDKNGANIGRRDRFGFRYPPESKQPKLGDPFKPKLPTTALQRMFKGQIEASPEAMLGVAGGLLEIPPKLRPLAHATFRVRPPGGHAIAPPTKIWKDALGRPICEVDGLNRVRRFQYDESGNEIARIDRDGRLYTKQTVSWNLVGARVDPLGHAVRFEYSSIEQFTAQIDPLGSACRWTYDPAERHIATSRFDRLRDTYEYDIGDHMVAKYDGSGELLLRYPEYHPNHFFAKRELASGDVHLFDYDPRGNITRASTQDHEVRRRFDYYGTRLHDSRDGEGIERKTSEGRERVRVLDRFLWTSQTLADGTIRLTACNGERTHIRHAPDGMVSLERSNGTREWLQYDHEGRLEGRLSARPNAGGTHVGWGARYAYSKEGDLLSVADSVRGTTTYETDAAHRLVAEVLPTGERHEYRHDDADNLIQKPGLSRLSIDSGNRASASATELFEHDGRDRIAVRRHRDGPITRFHYDSVDRLERIDLVDGETERTWRAAYDATGRRLWTEVDGRRREFYWDGHRLAAELDPEGRLRIYLYAGQDAYVPYAFVDYESRDADIESGRVYHVFCDAIGLPLHIEDSQREIVWWARRVDPYGTIEVHESAKIEFNLRFPGHYFDAETGLHYNRYRYYDPGLGRYLTPDPIGHSGSKVNIYAYCPNPLVQVDILGLAHSGSGDGTPNRHAGDAENSTDPPPPHEGGGTDPTSKPPAFPDLERGGGRTNEHAERTAAMLDRLQTDDGRREVAAAMLEQNGVRREPTQAELDAAVADHMAQYPGEYDPPNPPMGQGELDGIHNQVRSDTAENYDTQLGETAESLRIRNERSATVIEHSDGSTTIGLSGSDEGSGTRTSDAQRLTDAMNATHPEDNYHATDRPVETQGLREHDEGNPRGQCSEPSAAQGARDHNDRTGASSESYQTVWAGDKPPSEHQRLGPDGQPERTSATGPTTMDPCRTCQRNGTAGNHQTNH